MALDPENEKAVSTTTELFKVIIATSGIMLTLLWGLTQRQMFFDVSRIIRAASIVLLISITSSLLGLQFIVAELERKTSQVTKARSVAFTFLIGWLAFLVGCLLLVWAFFNVQFQSQGGGNP